MVNQETKSQGQIVVGPTGMVFTSERDWLPVEPVNIIGEVFNTGIQAAKDRKNATALSLISLALAGCSALSPALPPVANPNFHPEPDGAHVVVPTESPTPT